MARHPGRHTDNTAIQLCRRRVNLKGTLYLSVPVEAVRDLIVQHGGEHENHEPPATDEGETGEEAAPDRRPVEDATRRRARVGEVPDPDKAQHTLF
jgi:hypothetical protein